MNVISRSFKAIKRVLALIACAPFSNGPTRHRVRGIVRYGLIRLIGLRLKVRRNNSVPTTYYLAVCLIAKNEGRYLSEWIDWHKSKGVEKFYIYDNDSDDNTEEVLRPYILDGTVEYTPFPGKRNQLDAYGDCLERHRFDTRWIAFIDADEFIVPLQNDSIPEFLKDFEAFSAVEINWLCFGSGGAKKRETGGVMERFRMHAAPDFQDNRYVKSIVNPRCIVNFPNVHEPAHLSGKVVDTHGNTINRNYKDRPPLLDKIRINHYSIKSLEEFLEKRSRGRARRGSMRKMDYFWKRDRNEINSDADRDKT
jgi:hypothetical protein